MMKTYLQDWFKLSGLGAQTAQRITTALETNTPRNLNSSEQELYYYANHYSDYTNLNRLPLIFSLIRGEVDKYFSNLTNHHQYKDIVAIKTQLAEAVSHSFLIYLWSVEIFRYLGHRSSEYVLEGLPDLQGPVNTRVFTLVEVVEGISQAISTRLLVIWIQLKLETRPDQDLAIKKATYQILHAIALNSPSQEIQIYVKEVSKIIPTKNFLNLNIKTINQTTNSSRQKAYLKLTLMGVSLGYHPNPLERFGVWFSGGKILHREDVCVAVAPFMAVCHNFIVQRFNKNPTTITPAFIKKIGHLAATKYYPDRELINHTTTLVQLEITELLTEVNQLREELSTPDNCDGLLANQTQILEFIKQMFNLKQVGLYKQTSAEAKVRTHLTNTPLTNKTPKTLTVYQLNKLGEELQAAVQRWCAAARLTRATEHTIASLQRVFSRLYIYQNYLIYTTYLTEQNIKFVCFPTYLDFRGRVYQKSSVAIQAYWCFRHLYHFGEVANYPLNGCGYVFNEKTINLYEKFCKEYHITNPNLFEFFQSIGFLFKHTLVNPAGEIYLHDAVRAGGDYYIKYHTLSIGELWSTLDKDAKLTSECYYYIYAINAIRQGCRSAFYILKDTTCSMAQHAGKLLGYNTKHLTYLNLANREYAIDTYQIFIQELQKYLRLHEPGLWDEVRLQLLSRKFLKNLIMTSEYGVTLYTARNELQQLVRDFEIRNPAYSVFRGESYVKSLFNALSSGVLDKYFYLQTKASWIDQVLRANTPAIQLTDIQIPIAYYKPAIHTLYYEHKSASSGRTRSTLSVQFFIHKNLNTYLQHLRLKSHELQSAVDMRKTRSAVYVNAIHALDAAYLRELAAACFEHGVPLATIHDGFAVPYTHSSWILSAANECFFAGIGSTAHYYAQSKLTLPEISSNSIIV